MCQINSEGDYFLNPPSYIAFLFAYFYLFLSDIVLAYLAEVRKIRRDDQSTSLSLSSDEEANWMYRCPQ